MRKAYFVDVVCIIWVVKQLFLGCLRLLCQQSDGCTRAFWLQLAVNCQLKFSKYTTQDMGATNSLVSLQENSVKPRRTCPIYWTHSIVTHHKMVNTKFHCIYASYFTIVILTQIPSMPDHKINEQQINHIRNKLLHIAPPYVLSMAKVLCNSQDSTQQSAIGHLPKN